jgi:GNAT superfamily N-acetyltransferase
MTTALLDVPYPTTAGTRATPPATAAGPTTEPAIEPAIEPYEPSDHAAFVRLFGRLSRTSIHRRYFTLMPRLNSRMLQRLLDDVDHLHHELLVVRDGDEIVAEARYIRLGSDPTGADLAITVEDARQRVGLAPMLLEQLTRLAARRGIRYFSFTVLAENAPALALIRRMAPQARGTYDGTEVHFVVPLCTRRRTSTR